MQSHGSYRHHDKGNLPSLSSATIDGGQGSKFNTSMERRVERLWVESQEQGWNYSGFVAHVLEVLVVLQERDKVVRQKKLAP
jgi:hypothetical protein